MVSAPSASAFAAWLLVKLAYVACGGQVAAHLAPTLLARRDGHPDHDAIALFLITYGLVLLWPVPLLMSLENHRD